jgi:hypothetical protein
MICGTLKFIDVFLQTEIFIGKSREIFQVICIILFIYEWICFEILFWGFMLDLCFLRVRIISPLTTSSFPPNLKQTQLEHDNKYDK